MEQVSTKNQEYVQETETDSKMPVETIQYIVIRLG